MTKRLDLIGQQFGRLTVISLAHKDERDQLHWMCKCTCGVEKTVKGGNLQDGNTRSCGCLSRQLVTERSTTHGASRSPEYKAWADAKRRCTNPKDKDFPRYGGRGIQFLFNSFEEFLAHIGTKPHEKLTLDRINVNGDYAPKNIRWATIKEQNNNKRCNVNLVYKGRTQNIAAWARELGIHRDTIRYRLKQLGWSVEKTLGTASRAKAKASAKAPQQQQESFF